MKKSNLVYPVLLGALAMVLFSCKKSGNVEALTKSDRKSVIENFPILYNLSNVEKDSLITLLRGSDEYIEAFKYANTLKNEPLKEIPSNAILKRTNSFTS